MLVGEHHHKLDDKGRVSLPAAFRKSLPKDLMVTVSPQGDCLLVFDAPGFDAWIESLFAADGGYSSSNSKHLRARKVLNARANAVEVDSAGRIGLAAKLRSAVGLDKEVAIIGDTDHFEIWDAQRWQEFVDEVDLGSLFTD